MSYDKFESDFCEWFNRFDNSKTKTRLLSSTLRHITENVLPSKDEERLFLIRNFLHTENININLIYRNLWCKPDKDKGLLVGVLCPNWSSGWKDICKDEFISDQIDTFFFIATQYIYRSFQINLIGSIAFTYNRYVDYKGNYISQTSLPSFTKEFQEFERDIKTKSNKRTERVKHYLNIINALDPHVNKALYYYVKAITLYDNNFSEEAVTNLDNSIDVMTQFVKERLRLPTLARKDILSIVDTQLGLGKNTLDSLEKLYLLRCRFSSHPAFSKWWDFGEIYEDNIESFFHTVRYSLVKMFEYETNNRTISPNPEKWSDWFKLNADKVYNATWFNRLI
ncbi:MAG TPA: hypothetical protein VEF53_01610 [Patescibacteria group bacterium]|nr:hypothetical protein [Patescibacteria group bacterium]